MRGWWVADEVQECNCLVRCVQLLCDVHFLGRKRPLLSSACFSSLRNAQCNCGPDGLWHIQSKCVGSCSRRWNNSHPCSTSGISGYQAFALGMAGVSYCPVGSGGFYQFPGPCCSCGHSCYHTQGRLGVLLPSQIAVSTC